MKKIVLFFLGTLLTTAMVAQTAQVLSQSETSARIHLTTPDLQVSSLQANAATYNQLLVEGFVQSDVVGQPSLPRYSRIIEVPLGAKVVVKVSNVASRTLSGSEVGLSHPVLPAQPPRSKSDTSAAIWQQDAKAYSTNDFLGNELVQVEMIGIARDRQLARLVYSPLRYNPVTSELMFTTSADVELIYEGADLAATYRMKQLHHSLAYGPQTDLLTSLPEPKDTYTQNSPIRYTIVCYSGFRGQLDSLVAWKRKKGFLTDIVYTDNPAVGTTTTSIANYLKSLYTNATATNPAPTYVLLVGDVAQVPAFDGTSTVSDDHVTDLYYVTWTTGDDIPDAYIGRFSAQNATQVASQVSKTLLYERYAFADPSYLSKGVLIAGVDGGYSTSDNGYTYGDPACDYIAKTYVNADNGFTDVTYYKNNTSFAPTGVTVTGSSQNSAAATALRNLYNQGAGWVNYTAHGSATSWYAPNFTTSHVAQMTNNGKPMMMIGNCCLTNKFEESECFGEALVRKGNNAGAIAYIGGSNSTYWTYDFYWMVGYRSNCTNTMNTSYDASNRGMYDNLFHTHGEPFSQHFTSTSAMQFAGNMEVQSTYGSSAYVKYYWEIYHVMGDPALEPWLGEASTMPFQGDSTYIVGAGNFSFTTAPYVYCALMQDDTTLLSSARSDGQGSCSFDLSSLIPGSYTIALTGQNHQPRFITLTVLAPNGAWLVARNIQVQPADVHPGDTVSFSFNLLNLGADSTTAAMLRLTSGDNSRMRVLNDTLLVSSIAAHDTLPFTAQFLAVIADPLTEGDIVPFTLTAYFDADSTVNSSRFSVSAPGLQVTSVTFNPQPAAGVTSTVSVQLTNAGSLDATGLHLMLFHAYGLATVVSGDIQESGLPAGESTTLLFTVTFSANLTPNPAIPFRLQATCLHGALDTTLSVRYGDAAYDDFESNGFSTFNWQQGSYPWIITTGAGDTDQGQYQARSKQNLDNRSTSELSLSYTSLLDDTVAFDVRVSSETNYDKFHFYIDDEEQVALSGEVSWQRQAYPVAAGTHTFKFTYQKDYSYSSGSDCAWIDNVQLPANFKMSHYLLDTVCAGTSYTYRGRELPTDSLGTMVYVDSTTTDVYYLSFTVTAIPQVAITASNNSPVAGEQVVLQASGASRYLWSTGETTASIVVVVSDTATYSVTGYVGSCSSSDSIVIYPAPQSVLSPAADLHLRLFPNPAEDRLTVEAEGCYHLTLIDLSGRVLMVRSQQQGAAVLDVQKLAKGLYFVKVTTPDASVVRKVVIR